MDLELLGFKPLTCDADGKVDISEIQTLKSLLDAFLKVAGEYAKITLDFANLAYVSSAGLRAILTLQKQVNRTGGSLTLINVSPAVMEVFEMTGFSGVLHII